LAIGVGYVLGRNHKLKWAVLLGTAAATGQMRGLSTQALERGTKMLRANPEFSKLADTATGLLQAGRSAAVSAMQSRTEALTGTLGDKAGQLGEAGEKATGKLTERAKSRKGGDEKARDEDAEARDEDAEDEYDEDDEYEDEADDQNAEDEEDSGDEVEDEEEDEEEDEDEDEEEEEEEQKEPEPAAKGGRQGRGSVVRRTGSRR
jgi:hypothetical protein